MAQVAQNLVNCVMSKPFLAMFLAFSIEGQISSLYIIISSWSKLSANVALFFLLMVIDFFAVIQFMFHSLSYSHVASVKFVKNARRISNQIGRDTWFRKFLRSCAPLKVGMGDGKYFDELTTFVIWQFCVDRLINLLLLE